MASFQAKIGWKTQRKRENKNCRFIPFRSYTTRNTKFQKNSKKIQKFKKCHYGFISSQNRLQNDEKGRKQKLSLRFVPTRHVIENSKKIEKKFKKLKNTVMYSFQAKIGLIKRRKGEKKNLSVPFLPDA